MTDQWPHRTLQALLLALGLAAFLFGPVLVAQDNSSDRSGGIVFGSNDQENKDLLVTGLPILPAERANLPMSGEGEVGRAVLSGLTVQYTLALLASEKYLDINLLMATTRNMDQPVEVVLSDLSVGELFTLILQLNELRAVRFNENTLVIVDQDDDRTFGVKRRKVYTLTYISTAAVRLFIEENENLSRLLDLGNIIEDANNNSFIVFDTEDRIKIFDHIVSLLDVKSRKITAQIPLSHIDFDAVTAAIERLPEEVRARINGEEMIFSTRGRTLIYHDIPEDIALLRDIIRQIDIGHKQVLVDVTIMEVTQTLARDIGIRLLASNLSVTSLDKLWNLDRLRTDLATSTVPPTPAQLTYVLQNQGGKTIANPKIRVVDGESATITIGQIRNVRVQTSQFSGNNLGATQQTTFNTQEVPIGVTLSVEPEVHNDGTVSMQLDIADEEIIAVNEFGVDRTTRNSNTVLRIRDGETVILGGFINRNISYDRTPIPVLGRLPLLKKLFRTNSRQKLGSELIILLTPYILDYDSVVPRTEVNVVPPGKPIQVENLGYTNDATPELKTTTTRWTSNDSERTKIIYNAQGEVIYRRSFPKTSDPEAILPDTFDPKNFYDPNAGGSVQGQKVEAQGPYNVSVQNHPPKGPATVYRQGQASERVVAPLPSGPPPAPPVSSAPVVRSPRVEVTPPTYTAPPVYQAAPSYPPRPSYTPAPVAPRTSMVVPRSAPPAEAYPTGPVSVPSRGLAPNTAPPPIYTAPRRGVTAPVSAVQRSQAPPQAPRTVTPEAPKGEWDELLDELRDILGG